MKKKSLILFSIIILSIALRLINISSYGLWKDENATILIANGQKTQNDSISVFSNFELLESNNFKGVVNSTVADNGNSILYNLSLHYWQLITGHEPVYGHLLSLLFGILTVFVSFHLSNFLFRNVKISLFISLLFALHPVLVEFSQELRSYSMGIFISLLSSIQFFRIIENKISKYTYLIYTFLTVCAMLTHYLIASVFVAHLLVFIIFVREKIIWKNFFISATTAVIIFLFWMNNYGFDGLLVMDSQNEFYKNLAENFTDGKNTFYIPSNFKNIITGWFQVWLQVFGNQFQNFQLRIREILVLFTIPLSTIIYTLIFQYKNKIVTKKLKILAIFILTQTIFSTILSIKSGHCIPFQPLYSNFIIPYAIILLGYSMFFMQSRIKLKIIAWIINSLILCIFITSLIPTYFNLTNKYPAINYELEAAKEIELKYKEFDTISVKSPPRARLINLYLNQTKKYEFKIDTTIRRIFIVK